MSGLSRRALLAGLGALLVAPAQAAAAPALKIEVVSNRADLSSAGDALVSIDVPARVAASRVRVTDDGRDVTSAFARRPDGSFQGLVTGLAVGSNRLRATAPGAQSAAVTVVNHPNGGPVFSRRRRRPAPPSPSSSASRRATRTATSTRSRRCPARRAVGAVGAAAAVQPPAADHARGELRDRASPAARPASRATR